MKGGNQMRTRGVILFLCALLAAGCGGSGGSSSGADSRGAIRFTIQWPEPGRLIPSAAQSIQIALSRDGQTLVQRTVARPPVGQNTSTETLDGLTPGQVLATASAHPSPNGTGVAQATGAVTLTIVADQITPAVLTLNSTIARVDLLAVTRTIVPDSTLGVTALARDGGGATVLTDPANWSWSSSDPTVATVVPSGETTVVTGVRPGSATITAVERESGRSGSVVVTVVAPVSVAIRPPTATVPLDGRQQFTADVSGTANTAVTWSVQEGAAGGSVDETGLYNAPDVAGVYHVVATSVADPTKSAVATVTVPIEISIEPPSAALTFGSRQQFTATVQGTSNTGVFWSVSGPPTLNPGTVDSTGLYTAPGNDSGTFVVRATSQADPSRFAEATVTVGPPT